MKMPRLVERPAPNMSQKARVRSTSATVGPPAGPTTGGGTRSPSG